MRKGEKWILGAIALIVAGMMGWNAFKQQGLTSQDTEIPYYSTASQKLRQAGSDLYRRYQCKRCHSLWTVRDIMQRVPAPPLDGIGSLRSEEWLLGYLSAEDPQSVLPSRLKEEFQMPSYAHVPEGERETLAAYLASLKVEDWYLEETRRRECLRLTGEEC